MRESEDRRSRPVGDEGEQTQDQTHSVRSGEASALRTGSDGADALPRRSDSVVHSNGQFGGWSWAAGPLPNGGWRVVGGEPTRERAEQALAGWTEANLKEGS